MKRCPKCNLKYPNESNACFVDGTALESFQDPRVGTTLGGRYFVEDVIGEGGMATVYRARHKLVDRLCAVKIMNPTFAGNEVIKERFRREAKAAQKLAHPNIIEIFDQGDAGDGSLYLVMELLDGETLADVLEHGKVPIERALPIAIEVSRALARAHDFEVIHRDLKPENIFLARTAEGREQVKLLDFGIARSMQDARLTGAGEVFGTPQYMAPERITSIDAGPSADLYAVGVILFEMLTGELPFDAPDIATFFIKHMKEAPPRVRSKDPAIPEKLDKLVAELLAKSPRDRPVDAHRVHADLVSVAGAIGIRVPAEPSGELPSSRQEPAATLRPVAIERWVKRTAVFEQMLQRAYAQRPPQELTSLLGEVKRLVKEVAELRSKSVHEQRKLETLEARGREGRQRFGHAVDALGIDASRARDEVKNAETTARALGGAVETAREQVKKLHAGVMLWEGRSGFAEPYAELSEAYRTAAKAVDEWLRARQRHKIAEQKLETKNTEVSDLEFQIQELRAALAKHAETIDDEIEACQKVIAEMGQRADQLEVQLLEIATKFCAPLRRRPELGQLFQELEAEAAA